ncbi:MAG: COR domain-containing protein [Planctomycetota bacterium]
MSESGRHLGTDKARRRITAAKRERLAKLDLAGLGLATVPPGIEELPWLRRLDLGNNQLTALPEEIESLTELQELVLSRNRLATLPPEITKLTTLESLDLRHNQLDTLPPEIAKLTTLQHLDLAVNHLNTLPPEITKLTALHTLFLGGNQLAKLPPEVAKLSALRTLALDFNQLTKLPPEVAKLSALRSLFLNSNLLTSLPADISRLHGLRNLSASDNRLLSLPKTLLELGELEWLFLQENPGLGVPNEVLGPDYYDVAISNVIAKSPRHILQYYFDVVHHGEPLQECKLIVVGRGGAGKTTLIKRLNREPYNPDEPETHGITISDLAFKGETGEVTSRVWDFGGQVILHSMHEFFMTARSLYLLVLGERDDMLERDATYWLQLIRSYADDAPVIVVLNKSDGRERFFDRKSIEKEYGPILGWMSTECSADDEEKAGIEQLRKAITQAIDGPTMDSVRRKFPTKWAEIKRYLEDMPDSFVDYARYREICSERGEKDEQQQQWLSQDLHDLGVALNYQNDPRLRDTSVLRPDWLANGIYAVLRANDKDEKLPAEYNKPLAPDGQVSLASLEDIYAKAESWKMLRAADYPLEKREFLLRLMDTFHLSYPLDSETHTHLVPSLLPVHPPDEAQDPTGENQSKLRYEFQVVPAPLIPWFIAKTFTLIPGHLHWRRGAMLRYAGAKGKIWTTPEERYVYVTVVGETDDAKQLLSMVRGTLQGLFEVYEGLKVVEQHDYDGAWVPRPTLEKIGVLEPQSRDDEFEFGGDE